MLASVLCDEGSAVKQTPDGLPVVIGRCASDEAPSTAQDTDASGITAAGPADCVVPGYDDRCESWVAPRYDGPWASDDYPGFGSFDRHTTVLHHPTRDLVFVGGTSAFTNGGLPDADFVEIAYQASTGRPIWTATYEGLDHLTLAYQHSIALSPDGETLYAIGTAAEPGVYDYEPLAVAFETATGNRLWARRIPISAEAIEIGVITLPSGEERERIYLAGIGPGTSPTGAPVPAGAVAALDEVGAPLWTSTFAGQTPDGARFNELVISPDGSRIYAGGGEHAPDRLVGNFATVAFRASDGEQLWVSRITRTQASNTDNGISDMQVTPNGARVIVTGFDGTDSPTIGVPSTNPIFTIAHETDTGAVAWQNRYGGPVAGETHFYFTLFQGMMDLSPDGRTVVVTAAINSRDSTGTVAYDVLTGSQRWGVESVERGYVFTNYVGYYPSVQVSGDRAYVSNRRGIGVSQYATVTTAYGLQNGALAWTARLGLNRTLFGGNALSPDGTRLFVSASDELEPDSLTPDPGVDTRDILTVAYDA
jgi:hypothetical protein